MEKQCTYLIFEENLVRPETSELSQSLQDPDIEVKARTLKTIILLMLNGEQLGSLLMKVIQYVVPNDDKPLKKLLYLYLEAVEKRSPDGRLLPEMILICNMIRNDLNHPNEFVRGSALRFLSRMKEKDILEPLVSSLKVNLEHRQSYVRRNAVLAIYNTFRLFEELIPDGPELIRDFIDSENDVSAKRNAFVMLCNSDQERAVSYMLSVIDQIESLGDIIQLIMLELIRKVCRQDPFQRSRFLRAVFNLQSSASNSVAFECASTLVSLSSSQTAVKTAVQVYCHLLATHSENNVKLIVIDKLADLQKRHSDVLKSLTMDVIRGIASPNLDIKTKILDLVLQLIGPSNIEEVMVVLKKEILKAPPVEDPAALAYRQALVQAIHACVLRFPDIAGTVVDTLIDFIADASPRAASDVAAFVREVVETFPRLRGAVVAKVVEFFPAIKVPKAFRVAMWILSEYSRSPAEVDDAFAAIYSSLGPPPFACDDDPASDGAAAASGAATTGRSGPAAVLSDGTYASQSSASMAVPSQGQDAGGGGGGGPHSLRSLLLAGDFFVGVAAAVALTKLVVRASGEPGADPAAVNERAAGAMERIVGMARLGQSGAAAGPVGSDGLERLWVCLLTLSDLANERLHDVWGERCRASFATLLVEKQHAAAAAAAAATEGAGRRVAAQADDLIVFRQLRGRGAGDAAGAGAAAAAEDDGLDVSRAVGLEGQDGDDFGSRLRRVTQLTGLSDPVYAEAVVTSHVHDVVLDVHVVNRLDEPLREVVLDLATVGDLRLCERPAAFSLPPHGAADVRVGVKVSSTETGLIYGTIWYERAGPPAEGAAAEAAPVILNSVRIDIMDYITAADCSAADFRAMWAEFEWENKVTVCTPITSPSAYLAHMASGVNLRCLADAGGGGGGGGGEDEGADACGFLAANLYARSVFGEDVLVNVSLERQRDGALGGTLRIRSKAQGIALSLGARLGPGAGGR